MWELVYSQLEKAKLALINNNRDVAFEVVSREKRVNAYELMNDSNCENYIALYSPVAIDLRFVLSLLKINSTLERIGDFAESIARFYLDSYSDSIENLIISMKLEKMFDEVLNMLKETKKALETEDTKHSGALFAQDDFVDNIYHESIKILAEHLKQNPKDADVCLKLAIVSRKLERIGDHCNNIVEEIVFYIDAKVLKHNRFKAVPIN